jgi:hypothetical protein
MVLERDSRSASESRSYLTKPQLASGPGAFFLSKLQNSAKLPVIHKPGVSQIHLEIGKTFRLQSSNLWCTLGARLLMR